jgi:NAD(P)-dependent dehydrogenase (short-subunit alcohol dehydrogenase family)
MTEEEHMNPFDLTGTVAVVTGGNRGIGFGIAVGLARAGADVAVWARDRERSTVAVRDLETHGHRAIEVRCDVAQEQDVEAATAATVAELGRIDTLFVNAGIATEGGVLEMTLSEWQRVIDVNVGGAFLVARSVARHMADRGAGGSIVFTSSIAAHRGFADAPHYAASKAAMLRLAKALAVELGPAGIRCNTLSPGWIATELTDRNRSDDRFDGFVTRRTPAGRWGGPEDLAGPAVFLASKASEFVSGAEILVDGGFSAG